MNNVFARPAVRIAALVVAVALLIAGILVVVNQGDDDQVERVILDDRTPEERAREHLDTLPDTEHQGRLITVDAATVTFRLVRVLRGPEAVEAAQADGRQLDHNPLPDDTYVQDQRETRTLPIAEDVAIQVQQCADGCQEVATTLDALVAGEAAPHGGDTNVFVFTVRDGTVVAMNEVVVPQ